MPPFITPAEDIPRGTTPIYLALLCTLFAGMSLLAGRTRPPRYLPLQDVIGVVQNVYTDRRGTWLRLGLEGDTINVSDPDLPQVAQRMRTLRVNDTVVVVYDTHAWHLWGLSRQGKPLVTTADIKRWRAETHARGQRRALGWGILAGILFGWVGVTLYRDNSSGDRPSDTARSLVSFPKQEI